MAYMNEYKHNICYESNSLINLKARALDDDDDLLEKMRTEKYSSANVFPIQTEGGRKGQFVAIRDEKGNIVVDPASLITKDPFFIDYNIYRHFKNLTDGGRIPHVAKRFTKREREEMRILFGKHEPVCDMLP